MRIRFEGFVLDSGRRELTRAGQGVRLSPRAFRLLTHLAEKRPDAVNREELYDALWPKTFVQHSNLDDLIYQLRRALDDSEQRIIRTVYGFGFAFVAAVASEEIERTPPQVRIVVGEAEFDLHQGENLIGRGRDCTVRIDNPSVSRHHSRVIVGGPEATIEDLGSKNGTWVDGRRARLPVPLANGAKLLIGTVAATFHTLPPDPSTETAR